MPPRRKQIKKTTNKRPKLPITLFQDLKIYIRGELEEKIAYLKAELNDFLEPEIQTINHKLDKLQTTASSTEDLILKIQDALIEIQMEIP